MDVEIVNRILRLCIEEEKCAFDIADLFDYCREVNHCSHVKYVLASMRNYMEIFRISPDQQRMEFVMPFEICRKKCGQNEENLCSDLHLCYDYFHRKSCRRLKNCSSLHGLKENDHQKILGLLIDLDLNLLTEAFRVYCRIHKHSEHQNGSQSISIPQINGHSSWKMHHRPSSIVQSPSQQTIVEKGVQICWKPNQEIPRHFIDVIFSHPNKSHGGPIRIIQLYQHLGIAQVFYENSDLVDRVVSHGSVPFQSFTFIPRLLQRTIDRRHLGLSDIPANCNEIDLFIEKISPSSRKFTWKYYQNDPGIILIEYDDDIDFPQICVNFCKHPEYQGSIIHPIQLYLPETLLLEYESNYSEEEIHQWFSPIHLFHIQTYSFCSFVHFYSHQDLQESMQKSWANLTRISPIYIDLYSSKHLNDYLHQREIEWQRKSSLTPSISDDDFHDIPSEFDEDDLNLDKVEEKNEDLEFFQKTAKHLLKSLEDNQDIYSPDDKFFSPFTISYADDYIVSLTNGLFASTFLNYTQYLIDKQENLDRMHLMTSLKKRKKKKISLDGTRIKSDQTIESKNRNKKKTKRQ